MEIKGELAHLNQAEKTVTGLGSPVAVSMLSEVLPLILMGAKTEYAALIHLTNSSEYHLDEDEHTKYQLAIDVLFDDIPVIETMAGQLAAHGAEVYLREL